MLNLNDWFLDYQVRNTSYNDQLLDYLNMYGNGQVLHLYDPKRNIDEHYHLRPDNEQSTFQPSLEFSIYIKHQKSIFVSRSLQYMGNRLMNNKNIRRLVNLNDPENRFWSPVDQSLHLSPIVEITRTPKVDCASIDLNNKTLAAMRIGYPIIVNGILHDQKNKVIALPELLIRSDILPFLFQNFQSRFVSTSGSGFDGKNINIVDSESKDKSQESQKDKYKYQYKYKYKYKYVPMAIHFATNEIAKSRVPQLSSSSRNGKYYEALLLAQSLAIENLTGHESYEAYLLGRGWKCDKQRNVNAFDCPATINCHMPSRPSGLTVLLASQKWMKKLRAEGPNWKLLPEPTVDEIRPNMKNKYNFPWDSVKHKLSNYYRELTELWYVSVANRNISIMKGITHYGDPRLTTEMLARQPKGIVTKTLEKIIRANQFNPTELLNRKKQYLNALQTNNSNNNSNSNSNNDTSDSNGNANTGRWKGSGKRKRNENCNDQDRNMNNDNRTRLADLSDSSQLQVQLELESQQKRQKMINDCNNNSSGQHSNSKTHEINPCIDNENTIYNSIGENKTQIPVSGSSSNSNPNTNSNPMDLQIRPLKFQPRHRELLKHDYNYIDFFVDFETKNSIDDPMTTHPYTLDSTMIAMIGLGYEDPNTREWIQWIFKVRSLTLNEEKRIIEEWLFKMKHATDVYNLNKIKFQYNDNDNDNENQILQGPRENENWNKNDCENIGMSAITITQRKMAARVNNINNINKLNTPIDKAIDTDTNIDIGIGIDIDTKIANMAMGREERQHLHRHQQPHHKHEHKHQDKYRQPEKLTETEMKIRSKYPLLYPEQQQQHPQQQKGQLKKEQTFKIFHWSRAEPQFFNWNVNNAMKRHNRPEWGKLLQWTDLHQICRSEMFTIPGCFNFGLKSVVKALYKLGLIDKIWTPSPIEDGMKATIALLICGREAEISSRSMAECKWMNELETYLYLDISTMHAVLKYLRSNHL